MESELKILEEKDCLNTKLRIFGTTERPLFLARDVAEWIEYSKRQDGSYQVGQMLKNIDKDEKISTVNIINGKEMWYLTEDGLYEVLMQSRKPIAKKFKKEVKNILKNIRKSGGFIGNADLMVNTYFGALKDDLKGIVKGLFLNIEEQQKQLEEKQNEINYKSDVIKGLVENVDLATQRQILNRVVRKVPKFKERWAELYKQFEMKNNINLTKRLDSYNKANKPKLNKLGYIEKVLNQLPDLYDLACKLYENDVNELIIEMYNLNELEVDKISGGIFDAINDDSRKYADEIRLKLNE